MGIESNAAIDVQGQRKIVIYNRSKYKGAIFRISAWLKLPRVYCNRLKGVKSL